MSNHQSDRFMIIVNDAKTRVEELKPSQVKKNVDEDEQVVLLDVREREDWENAHISGADHLSRGVLEKEIERKLPNIDTNLILYSENGSISLLAADSLQKMGYNNIKSLSGGFQSWLAAGYPIEH